MFLTQYSIIPLFPFIKSSKMGYLETLKKRYIRKESVYASGRDMD
jgi:hypothetical protein